MPPSPVSVTEPFPIFRIADNHLIYDVNVVLHIRRNYNICGVLLGSLPQVPQQSVFLGLPLHLMPEEARLLVEQGHAYVVDDAGVHNMAILEGGLSKEEKAAFGILLRKQGSDAAEAVRRKAGERKAKALTKAAIERRQRRSASTETSTASDTLTDQDAESLLFSTTAGTEETASTTSVTDASRPVPYAITPTTSHPPLSQAASDADTVLPKVPSSYPLFKHLHSKGYFMMPGLRFGCHYTAYPGDPLRFHSHFLAVGKKWDEDIRIMEIVGGGRLGTGVKKAFMIGGQPDHGGGDGFLRAEEKEAVRAFSFEWAGM